MKKLINDPHDLVGESLSGFALAHGDIVRLSERPRFLTRTGEPRQGKVAVVSGGGSGHEPLHGGFVGVGMLDAAVPGPLFTSPAPDPIVAATRAVDGGAGVLYIVKNYTGDVLNFEVAAELVSGEGVPVRRVVVADDVAVEDSLFTAGRRGVAGVIPVEKIAGALAERGASIDDVARIAQRVASDVRSMGIALEPLTVPASPAPSFELATDEIEFGVGIHGEPGRARQPFGPADDLVERAVEAVLGDRPRAPGERVLLILNGLGSTPVSELYVAYRRAVELLDSRGLRVERSLVGNLVTALDMHGFSVTVMGLDDELVELWDAPVQTVSLRWGR